MTEEMEEITGLSGESEGTVRRVLRAVAMTVCGRDRTELRGFGVFTWRPFRGRNPEGRKFSVMRLWFRTDSMRREDNVRNP